MCGIEFTNSKIKQEVNWIRVVKLENFVQSILVKITSLDQLTRKSVFIKAAKMRETKSL